MTQVLRNPVQAARARGRHPPRARSTGPTRTSSSAPTSTWCASICPGADEQSVQVRFEKDVLSIEASPAVAPDPAWTPRHVEYQPGGYAREFRIADGIDVEAIRASLRNGVLELHLPKTSRRRPRTIQVAAA